MNRKELQSLYKVELKIDPKTGKDKKVARYIGPEYDLETESRDRVRPALIGISVGEIAVFVTAGLLSNYGANSFFVLPFYVFTLLPVFYLAMATVRVCRMKKRMDAIDLRDGLESLKHSALGLTVLGALWALGDIVFLCLGMAGDRLARELVFLACALLCAAGGYFAGRMVGTVRYQKKTEEKQSNDAAGESGPQG